MSSSKLSLPSIGYNGETIDAVTSYYFLGNGYRIYNPKLRIFYSPDSLSPYGGQGPNRYKYVHLNPIVYNDPTGHITQYNNRTSYAPAGVSYQYAFAITGIVVASLFMVYSGIGLFLGGFIKASGIVASVLGVIEVGLSGASVITGAMSIHYGFDSDTSNDGIADNLGYASLALGIAAAIIAVPKGIAKFRFKKNSYAEWARQVANGTSGEVISYADGILQTHGYPFGVFSSEGKLMNGKGLGEFMSAERIIERGYPDTKFYNFMVCHSGTGGRFSLAQRAANKFYKISKTANADKAKYYKDIRIRGYNHAVSHQNATDGIIFNAHKGVSAKIDNAGHFILHNVVNAFKLIF